ncbi:PhoH family protein, partial [Bacillus sp. D-CC]
NILSGVSGLSFITLEQTDVVRHPLVQRIIEAYDKME